MRLLLGLQTPDAREALLTVGITRSCGSPLQTVGEAPHLWLASFVGTSFTV